MNKKITKSMIVPAVCLSIMLSGSVNTFASRFLDSSGHWANDAIDIWSDYGVVEGSDGLFLPDNSMTRGEMAVMINRIMNYQEKAENTFSDLPESWYTDAILKLAKQGIMKGYDNHIRPEDPVSREESLVILSRMLNLEPSQRRDVSFSDAENISDWAKDAVQAMTEGGFINGYEDGSFRPGELMTRACFVTVVNNTIKGFYNKPGTYKAQGEINGFVIVNSPDVILEGMTINGDLIVSPGVKEGTVTLQGTTVTGEQIVMGGNVESKPGTSNPGEEPDNGNDNDNDNDNDNNNDNNTDNGSDNNTGGNTGGGSGSGGSSGGGSSSSSQALSTDIIVNSAYSGQSGRVTANGKRYTIGENAFDTIQAAVLKAQELNKKASITLMSDMDMAETIVLTANNLTFDGDNHMITFNAGVKDGIQVVTSDNVIIRDVNVRMQDEQNKWNGSYGIQAYMSTVTLRNITASGADAGVLVNGSSVGMQGVIDVTGNEFGGIEVAKGSEAETNPKLSGMAANLKNDTEEAGKPTVWIDKVSELTRSAVAVSGLVEGTTDKDQAHYYLNQNSSVTANVNSFEQLTKALANENIKIINLTNDIQADRTLRITRAVTINGQNGAKTITFENKDGLEYENAGEIRLENINLQINGNVGGWQGIYALQVYGATNAALKNVTATGADAGILVNGSNVSLEGIVNVTGNEFGGIEVAKGLAAEDSPRLSGTAANLKNDTEESGKPTIWIDKVSELTKAVVAVSGLTEGTTDKDQAHYFISESAAVTSNVSNLSELETALANGNIKIINLTNDIQADKTLEVTRPLTINGQNGAKTISFDNKNGMQLVNSGETRLENVNLQITQNAPGWQGIYALQVYGATNAVLKNVTATGADGGILVNGSDVSLEGIVNVTGNEFGGIEVAKGALAEKMPRLSGTSENLKNDTEEAGKPTIWIDKVSELTNAVVAVSGLNEAAASNDQTHFYLGEAPEIIK